MSSALQFSKQVGKSVLRHARGRPVVVIPDAPSPEPRYGHGKPPHPQLSSIIERGRARYRETLESFKGLRECFAAISRTRIHEDEPCWDNRWLPGLDAATLYGVIVRGRPARYIEIGSGNSTLFARRAVSDHDLPTRITSIDPAPREAVDAICDDVHRVPVQQVDLGVFDDLATGDVLFVDSSHRVLTNSDVAVVFMDILPRLAPGVLVHFHDIWLPDDYQPAWSDRHYTEQYMLAMLLLFGDRFEIVLPNHFITHDAELSGVLEALWSHPHLRGARRDGASFWIRTT